MRHHTAAALAAAITALITTATPAHAFTISGQWSYDPATSTFTLPGTPSPAEFEQYLLQAFPLYDGGDALAAALTGDAIIAVNALTYRVYDDGFGGTLGELGVDITFNPIATGGTQSLSTGGDYLDRTIGSQKDNELATDEVGGASVSIYESFGKGGATKRGSARDNFDDIFISFLGPVSLSPGALDVDANNLTHSFETTIAVVPGAPTGALLLPAATLLARRRRS